VSANGQTENDGNETLDQALEILNDDKAAAPDENKVAEATEEVATVLGDFA
jgi:hypothetical protein